MTQGDYDPRTRNGWAEYQRLVLAELERHNEMINEINRGLNEIKVQLALMKEENGKIKELQREVKVLQDSQQRQDVKGEVTSAVDQYKKWIIGIAITFVVSGLLPLITILLKIKGIG